jgi:hypothetical protein
MKDIVSKKKWFFLVCICCCVYCVLPISAATAPDIGVETDTLKKQSPKPSVSTPSPDSVTRPVMPQWELECATQYMDQVIFSGRNYGIQQFAVIPSVTLKHHSGFWVKSIGYYLSSVSQLDKNPVSKRDVVIGFQTELTKWWTTSIAASRWQYFGKSRAELRYTFDYFFSNYNAVTWRGISFTPQAYAMIGDEQRSKVVQIGLGITKYFEKRFERDTYGYWSIQPAFTVMTSTSVADGRNESPTWFQDKKLQVISYELVVPLSYQSDIYFLNKKLGKIAVTPTWWAVKAVNARPYDGAAQHPSSYWTADCKYILNF